MAPPADLTRSSLHGGLDVETGTERKVAGNLPREMAFSVDSKGAWRIVAVAENPDMAEAANRALTDPSSLLYVGKSKKSGLGRFFGR